MKLNNKGHILLVKAHGKFYKVRAVFRTETAVNGFLAMNLDCGLIDSDDCGNHYVAEIQPISIWQNNLLCYCSTMKNKPIESATVFFQGDRSVGIPSVSFDVQMYIEWDDLPEDSGEQHSRLKTIREKLIELYEELQGDTPSGVMFDFEIAEQLRQEKSMELEEIYRYTDSPNPEIALS